MSLAAAAMMLLAGCTETTSSDSTESASEKEKVTSAESQAEVIPAVDENGLYNTAPISQAYLTGDTSALDDMQKEIYDIAVNVLDEIITEGMDDYEKELAVHDYIVRNVTYEKDNLDIFGEHSEHSVDPYGALAEGECICSGYTTTFKMFMDMLEIPCRSTVALSDRDNEHAWNMVQINGHWYYVDVTWDDPVPDFEGRPVRHKYFNTSKKIMMARHEWDSSDDPVNDSEEDSYIAHELRTVENEEEIYSLAEESFENGTSNFYFEPDYETDWQMDTEDMPDNYISGPVEVSSKFLQAHGDYAVQWQRIGYGGRIVMCGCIVHV